MKSLAGVEAKDLIHPLDRTIFNYRDDYSTTEGKFVRLGSLVVVAPMITSESRLSIQHIQLMHRALAELHIDPVADAAESEERHLRDRSFDGAESHLHDAGYFDVMDKDTVTDGYAQFVTVDRPDAVLIRDSSENFGRAGGAGRELTWNHFWDALGADGITVLLR